MPRLKTMEQSLSSLSFIRTPICVSSHTYPNLSTNPVDFTFKSRLQPWLISPSLVQTINISCYNHCHSILVSLFPPLCPTSILTGQLEWFFKKGSSKKKKGSSSPPVAPISFRVKVTGPLFLMSDSHVYSISTTLASLLFLKHSRRARCLYLRALPMTFSLCLDCPLPPDIYMTDSLFPSSVCSKVTSVKPTDYPCLKLQPPIPLSCFPPPQSFLSNDFYYIFYAHLLPLNCKLCEFLLIKDLIHLINWIMLSIICQTLC